MIGSLAVVVSIPTEWLAILAVAAPVAIYVWSRRASQSCTVTESRVLAEKSVRNIEELWEKRDSMRNRIEDNRVRIARIEGAREAEQGLRGNPKIAP